MKMDVGSRVGPYEITAEIGAGGMGVVYRARDSRLGRDVAIKVSAEQFTERFAREARAVAALNHPNICTLHDVGPDYLVMELVEGETLADILASRPRSSPGLPLDEALRLSRQIAAALEAAHERGVVHRDLKPGNIKIKSDGSVKVLDFGLAKFDLPQSDLTSGREAHQVTNSPTLGATGVGLILGTAGYMAPEQARGKAVDKRADIWAFGVVLYEMVCGRRPFDGEDVSSILAAVIQSEPDWDGVPRPIARLLRKCLEKDPRRRLRDIGDAWDLIDEKTGSAMPRSKSGQGGWLAAAVLAALAIVAVWAPWRTVPALDRQVVRLDVDLGPDVALVPLGVPTPSSVVISPDGTRLAYVASVAGSGRKLMTRKLDEAVAIELVGTEGAFSPFFSPDGQWVGFHDGKSLHKISVEGGGRVRLMESTVFAGGFWTDAGDLLVGSGLQEGLLRVASSGGTPSRIVDLAPGELFYTLPQLLPGGNDVLVTIYGTPPGPDRALIDVISLKDHSRTTVARGGTAARYLPTGHLVYTNRSTMFAVPFDVEALEVRGAPVPVLTDVAFDLAAGISQYSISDAGTLVYRRNASGASGKSRAVWLDTSGKQDLLPLRAAQYGSVPRLSPDGTRVAFSIRDGPNQDIWIFDVERAQMTRVTFGDETFSTPIWTRDGKFIVFGSIGNGLYWARADGGGKPLPLARRKTIAFPFSISPDDTRVAFYEVAGAPQIWTLPLELGDTLAAGEPERYLASEFVAIAPMFSPDGKWMAYESNETGRPEVYVRAFPASGGGQSGKVSISNTGGSLPVWSPDGRELLYQSGDQVLAVDYRIDNGVFVAGKPRVWLSSLHGAQGFEIARDGKRLLALVPDAARDSPQPEHTVVFVQNFFDELRRRLPISK